MNEDPDVASKALRNWATGYLLKKSAGVELKKAIDEVLHGKTYVTPSIAQKLWMNLSATRGRTVRRN